MIEQLVAAAASESEAPTTPPPPAAPATEQTQTVLEDLTTAARPAPAPPKPAEGQAPPKPGEQAPAKQAVLDELLGKPPPNPQER